MNNNTVTNEDSGTGAAPTTTTTNTTSAVSSSAAASACRQLDVATASSSRRSSFGSAATASGFSTSTAPGEDDNHNNNLNNNNAINLEEDKSDDDKGKLQGEQSSTSKSKKKTKAQGKHGVHKANEELYKHFKEVGRHSGNMYVVCLYCQHDFDTKCALYARNAITGRSHLPNPCQKRPQLCIEHLNRCAAYCKYWMEKKFQQEHHIALNVDGPVSGVSGTQQSPASTNMAAASAISNMSTPTIDNAMFDFTGGFVSTSMAIPRKSSSSTAGSIIPTKR